MAAADIGSPVWSGTTIRLRAHTGNCIDISDTVVHCRMTEDEDTKEITIEKDMPGEIKHGDRVFFKTHTDNHIDVEGDSVAARWCDHGGWQTFLVEKEEGSGIVKFGDKVFLRTHTGNHLEVEMFEVRARFNDHGQWQRFTVEGPKPDAALRRRQRRVYDSDDDDDFFAAAAPVEEAKEEEEAKPVEIPKPKPGTTVGAMLDDLRKKLQQQLIEGMFKFAEQKYGRTRQKAEETQQQTNKEDYALYMNSLKVKAKQADTRLRGVLKQLKEIQAKVDLAQKDYDLRTGALSDAEKEKEAAAAEGRDPMLPASFIIPQRSKRAGATLGSLVMKASKKDWGAALEDFAARRGRGEKQPAWAATKRNKAAAMLDAGKGKTERRPSTNPPPKAEEMGAAPPADEAVPS